ncbi:MAG: phosphoenolpyruvate synthase/pyruvate phosphate dikinase [Desulfobulbaceae bacterium]|nr:phosphoenolpyruvate synthase/pyruvate phosphate dikinase [Desulfobulbaceae bacterium]
MDDKEIRLDVASDFQAYHELMSRKIRDILLVSSPYDAFIMEEDGSIASRIVNEYQGLNLSHPPRLQRVNSASQALEVVKGKKFDLVITMPHVDDMDAPSLGIALKKIIPGIPVVLLAHSLRSVSFQPETDFCEGIDHFFIWSTDPSLLLAIIKNVEDHLNVARDTAKAQVPVLIMVEDSPHYSSYMLPLIYQEVVSQTQAVMAESLNYEHRLLKMRARPKILVARNFEEALELYNEYRAYVFGVLADARFPRKGKIDGKAGLLLLSHIRENKSDLPLLLMSAESSNREKALVVPAVFLDKNSTSLKNEIHDFFLSQLGFGDFVFRMPDGRQVGWADNLRSFEEKISTLPEESLVYHAMRNHFSNWIMARSEVAVANLLRKIQVDHFASPREMRAFLVDCIHNLRKLRQKGIVAQFSLHEFDHEIMDFVKIGKGSIGGKARGLAFMANQLALPENQVCIKGLEIKFPKTLVISSDGYDSFILENDLQKNDESESDESIATRFLAGVMPSWLLERLKAYLLQVVGPLSIRSSSLLEDAQFRPYAGLYSTYMLPNNHQDFSVRLDQFLSAVKLVYASTFFAGPQAFARSTRSVHSGDDRMAIIIQKVVGCTYGDYFYPAVSGVAQSHNFYPVSHMLPEEGVATIALGLGKTVVEGEKSLRFSPRYPQVLPQFSSVDDILSQAQRFFYALKMVDYPQIIAFDQQGNLARLEVNDVADEFPVKTLSSSYVSDEHRIRDGEHGGIKILTFANILKYQLIPLPEVLTRLLEIGRRSMGCPVEIEFAVDIKYDAGSSELYFLQMRPMVVGGSGSGDVIISEEEMQTAFCSSRNALGHGQFSDIHDIVYVKPAAFEPSRTGEIAREIGRLNGALHRKDLPYLLIGPGRWGSADRWLGIGVQWQDISGVGAIIELRTEKLKSDPSQGTHFFHNITSMGIPYITVTEGENRLDWNWLDSMPVREETTFLRHVHCDAPLLIKINGKDSLCVIKTG